MKNIFLLDLDDTLLDFGKLEREQLRATLIELGARADEGVLARFHAINEGLWKALERGELAREQLVVARFVRLKEECALAIQPHVCSARFLQRMEEHVCPMAGVHPFLQALRAQGRLYALTNGAGRVQRRHMADAGIDGYFDALFISDEVGHYKPSHAYVAHVAAHLPDFTPARAVYLGDSLTSDRVCAARLGVDFLLFCPSGAPAGYAGRWVKGYQDALAAIRSL